MNALDQLMKFDPKDVKVQAKKVKRKLKKLDDLEVEFELKEVGLEEMTKIQEETLNVNTSGSVRMRMYGPNIKKILYGCDLFSNKDLQKRFGCETGKQLIEKILNKGDMDFLVKEIEEISGFDSDEKREEVENL